MFSVEGVRRESGPRSQGDDLWYLWQMFPGRPKVFRDPVHGDITYPRGPFQELVVSVINEKAFQRLRGIKQNGVTCLVFPGAEHSRFTHSMGVAWLAQQMFDSVKQNSALTVKEEEREATVLAALLHDVGHGPFSHLLEEILGADKFNHETMTLRYLREESSELCKLLRGYRQDLPNELAPYFDKSMRNPLKWYYSIVSSQLDADRLDYLARDGYMIGIQSHHFDSRRLISFLGADNDGRHLLVDARARDVLENYLLALDQIYQAVYYHHTVRSASWLVKSILVRVKDMLENGTSPTDIFLSTDPDQDPLLLLLNQGDEIDLDRYSDLDEHYVYTLFRKWTTMQDPILSDLCSRFLRRNLPKAIDAETQDFNVIKTLEERTVKIWQKEHPDLDHRYYIKVDTAERLGYKRYKSREGPDDSIFLFTRNGKVVPIDEVLRSVVDVIDKKYIAQRILVPPEIALATRELVDNVS